MITRPKLRIYMFCDILGVACSLSQVGSAFRKNLLLVVYKELVEFAGSFGLDIIIVIFSSN